MSPAAQAFCQKTDGFVDRMESVRFRNARIDRDAHTERYSSQRHRALPFIADAPRGWFEFHSPRHTSLFEGVAYRVATVVADDDPSIRFQAIFLATDANHLQDGKTFGVIIGERATR